MARKWKTEREGKRSEAQGTVQSQGHRGWGKERGWVCKWRIQNQTESNRGKKAKRDEKVRCEREVRG